MRVELSEDATDFRTKDWSDLVSVDPAGTFFHTPAYLKLWWEEFGSGSLLLAFAGEAGRTVGACAFEVVGDTLHFLGGFDVTDYMGPVGVPGREEAVAKELMAAVVEREWEKADLRGLPIESPWLAALEAAAATQGLGIERRPDGVAPLISLAGSFEAYLAALPAKLRHEIRRKDRRLVEQTGGYEVTLATPETLQADFDRFIDLHKASPGPKGRFMHAGMEIFFRRLGEAFLEPHQFHLAFLEVRGQKVAGAIGFGFGNTFSLYNSAFDRRFIKLAPGMVLVADLIRRAALGGRQRFDMLKGDLGYKYRFGASARPIERLVLTRPG
jgi:CelD/BcsL family acetyltransferase involved in cellulose biosynthesis